MTVRVLLPGGVLRFSTPNLRRIIHEYLAGRTIEWLDVHWSPSSPRQMMNESFYLWDHQFVYDAHELEKILSEAGFRTIKHVAWRQSETPDLCVVECRPFHDEIIIEAVK